MFLEHIELNLMTSKWSCDTGRFLKPTKKKSDNKIKNLPFSLLKILLLLLFYFHTKWCNLPECYKCTLCSTVVHRCCGIFVSSESILLRHWSIDWHYNIYILFAIEQALQKAQNKKLPGDWLSDNISDFSVWSIEENSYCERSYLRVNSMDIVERDNVNV